MNDDHRIFDVPMPPDRNFHWLKAKGIEYITQLSGNQWTNFNDSDPGVTILDQLCYALTELGYCTNFPIEDILCKEDGNIQFDDQFYRPEQILTCSPVTLDDYRKLIIDAGLPIKNVYIELVLAESVLEDGTTSQVPNGCYRVYLYAKQPLGQEDEAALPQKVYDLLNRHRNLGELFLLPQVLAPKKITLAGTVKLTDKASSEEVVSSIHVAMDNYISPPVRQYGYGDLLALGLDSDEIFNGPQLKNGWIPSSELAAAKTDKINLKQLAGILTTIPGIKSVSELALQFNGYECDEILVGPEEVGQIDVALTIDAGAQAPISLSQQLSLELLRLQHSHQAAKIGASVDMTPALPQGKYRNIESYYSVQNTFPSVYAIGPESLPVDSTDYRVAQSRQLKGYLMVFDQLLANQFSQLANVAQLFSFQGAGTIAPNQGKAYDGIPYQLFSPTYFCQTLYQIPDVKPLLLGHDNYRFSVRPINSPADEDRIWQDYQADPFNPYVQGLRENMEDDGQRDDRRNRMLDHLLARHGEPVALYDDIISTARWYGSTLKTRIIIKSILLQNFASLSYYRSKAYSLQHADRLGTPGRFRLTADGFHRLSDFGVEARMLKPFVDFGCPNSRSLLNVIYKRSGLLDLQKDWGEEKIEQFEKYCLLIKDGNALPRPGKSDLFRDGQLDLQKLNALEQLQAQDFNNFATVELRINLLLGLRQHYQLISRLLLSLVNSRHFGQWLNEQGDAPFLLPDSDITVSVERRQGKDSDEDHILFSGQCLLRIKSAGTQTPLLPCYQAHLEQIQWLATQQRGFLLIETLLLLEFGGLSEEALETLGLKPEQFYLRTLLVFPDYITLFGTATFQQNLEKLAAVYWPSHIANSVVPASFATLESAIPAFIKWRNYLKLTAAKNRPKTDALRTNGQPTPAETLAKLMSPGDAP